MNQYEYEEISQRRREGWRGRESKRVKKTVKAEMKGSIKDPCIYIFVLSNLAVLNNVDSTSIAEMSIFCTMQSIFLYWRIVDDFDYINSNPKRQTRHNSFTLKVNAT